MRHVLLAGVLVALSLFLAPASLFAFSVAEPLCIECLNIRIGRPYIARGPCADEFDTSFSAIRLKDGRYRGFSANGDTFALDGDDPWSMAGQRTQVLKRGVPGTESDCGRWLNAVIRSPSRGIFGFVHTERDCGPHQTHKSMALAISHDEGVTWKMLGSFLTGRDLPTPGHGTGEGDCSVVDGGDTYLYAYCLRLSDWRTIVARAPVSRPSPWRWTKYHQGAWSQPGRGGDATALGELGTAAAHWTETDTTLLFGVDPYFGGVKLSLSQDKIHFTTLTEPLLILEGTPWVRPADTELIAYLSALNYTDASNQIGNSFLLTHVWIPPGADFDQRYLVFRDVWVWISPTPVSPQGGVALSRWANDHESWLTTGPVPGNFATVRFEGTVGFLMTRPPALPSVRVEECDDRTFSTACSQRIRTAGWVYRDPQPNTAPLFDRGELLGYLLNN